MIAGYLEELASKRDAPGTYAYRGQANADWPLKSTACRRLEENDEGTLTQTRFISYHEKEILEPARMDGHGVVDGRELRDLELLAKLRHFRTATCLIDFTRNFFVALWFACHPHRGTDGADKNGKVFVVNTNDPNTFLSLGQQDLKKSIKEVLTFQTRKQHKPGTGKNEARAENPLHWHWSPHGMNERILKQDSLFIFGPPKMEDTLLQYIEVKQEDKIGLLQELETLGITRRSLFKDLPGFAESHGHNEPLLKSPWTAEDYFQAGNEARQRGEIDKAIENYNQAIKLNPDHAGAYNNQGIAKAILGDYLGAIEDYDQVIELNRDIAELLRNDNRVSALSRNIAVTYSNRGNAKVALGDYRGAIEDCDQAIKINPGEANAYYNRGNANACLGDHDAARRDYGQAIILKPDYAEAYCNLGITEGILENYHGAIANLDRAIELKPDYTDAYYNQGLVKATLREYRNAIADYDRAIELNSDHARAYCSRGEAKAILEEYRGAIADFDRAIKLKPDYVEACYNLGIVKDHLGEITEARNHLTTAKRLAKRSENNELIEKINEALSELDDEDSNG